MKGLQILLFSILSICMSFPVFANIYSSEIDLSQWGIEDAARIVYISAAIVEAKEGNKLLIYDLREQKPVFFFAPSSPKTKPFFQGDFFLLSHFNEEALNALGGSVREFTKTPAQAALNVLRPVGEAAFLSFSYSVPVQSYAGFSIQLFDEQLAPSERSYFDASPFSYLTFFIRAEKGEESIHLQFADQEWEKKQDSLPLQNFQSFLATGKIGSQWQQVWIPLNALPQGIDRTRLASIIFLENQKGDGKVFLKDLAFAKSMDVKIPSATAVNSVNRSFKKAMWLWQTSALLSSQKEISHLLSFAKREGISDIFLQIPFAEAASSEGRQLPGALRILISRLHEAGIRVQALDGDPLYALEKNHAAVLADIQKIIRYNHSVSAMERFDGIRYDNEVYLLPGFAGVKKQSYMRQYLALLEASHDLTRKAGISLGADIPFWFDAKDKFHQPTTELEGKPFSEWVIDRVDNVGIMDYRTRAWGSDGVVAQAIKELKYASQTGKEVFIGLETSALADELLYEFEKCGDSKASQIQIERIAPGKVRFYWLSSEEKSSLNSSLYLCETSRVMIASDKISFQNLTPQNLHSVMQEAEKAFAAFSAFAGFAIHSYESYKPWLEKAGYELKK